MLILLKIHHNPSLCDYNSPLMQILPPPQKSQLAPETIYTEIWISFKMYHPLVLRMPPEGTIVCEYGVESPILHKSDQNLHK